MQRLRTLLRYRPRIHPRRLASAPAIAGPDVLAGDRVEVELPGLLCNVCASRAHSALSRIEGIEEVRIDLDTATATMRLSPGAAVSRACLQWALERVVVGMPVRRALERLARRLRPQFR